MVTIPGSEGYMGVMAGHVPLITTLRAGVVTVSGEGDQRFYVIGGVAEVSATKLTVLAEQAVAVSDLDAVVLDQKIKNAEEDVTLAKDDTDRIKAQETLDYLNGLRAAM